MPDSPPTVVLADTEAWEAFAWLGAALRRRGLAAVRLTAPPRTRLQRVSALAYRWAYSATEETLRWPGGTQPVDVSAVRCVWESAVVDVQAADRVGAALVSDPRWDDRPRLHRLPEPDREMRLYDKYAQTEDAAAAGCAVPRTSTDFHDIRTDRVVVKQRLGSGGDAVVIVPHDEVPVWVERWAGQGGGLLFQEPIEGEVLNVGGFAVDGELLVAAAYSTEQSPVDPEGPSVAIRSIHRPDLLEAAAGYVAHLRYSGAICVDFISADKGYLIDVNPRFFGSWAALQAAGLPLVETYTDYLLSRPATTVAHGLTPTRQGTTPTATGGRWQTARSGTRLLRDFARFAGPRTYVAGLPSLGRAIRAAG